MREYKTKGYTHLDNRISFEVVKDRIQDPKWIASHGFYPFLHFELNFNKYSRQNKQKKVKIRRIYYASHIDGYIFSYYGDKLNNKYNEIAIKKNIDSAAIAYRNNKHGKSNIQFAAEVVKFISEQSRAFIFVADFTEFFDNLDHRYLKDKLKETLGLSNLPADYYNIFKNITKYSYINKTELERYIIDNNEDTYFSRKKKYLDHQQFHEYKYKRLYKNEKSYGIPQGSGISAVLSNVYLLDFDQEINKYVEKNRGLYRRYCDDIIIVIPMENNISFKSMLIKHNEKFEEITNKIPNLVIQEEKTKKFFYENSVLKDSSENNSNLDYLGFRFDGKNVFIREKSLFKFYVRAYKKVKICNKLSRRYKRKVYRRSLYKTYTHLGRYHKHPRNTKIKGNFISYTQRAIDEFSSNGNINVKIKSQIKRHWSKIQRKLSEVKNNDVRSNWKS
ncbi:reverse transcriptase domain-containing protein [Paenibacillus tundrae]